MNSCLYVWTAGADFFGFLVHYPEDVQERLLVFQLPSSEGTVTKEDLLKELCSLIAESNDSSDTVSNQWINGAFTYYNYIEGFSQCWYLLRM